ADRRSGLNQVSAKPAAAQFLNHYRCPKCGHEWTDAWDAQCDDDCPNCGARHVSPHRSNDLEGGA
ncbi:MAG: hypothetical protein WCP82_12265, partial [Alphaproteobacteria bacterium]